MNLKLDDIRDDITRAVETALKEDIGSGDITALLIPESKTDTAEIMTRDECVVCGIAWVDETFKQLGGIEDITWHVKDGDKVSPNTVLVTLQGNTRKLLTGERTALNFLQLLSGVATKANQYREALGSDSPIKILDTRKTIPGLRTAQKYAVATGGCFNHRIGLYDAFLIKENHIAACGGIAQAIAKAREIRPGVEVEIEVETLEELEQALEAGADIVMLDNFSEENLKKLKGFNKNETKFELSGNLDKKRIVALEKFPIEFMSSGSLTKHITSIDLSLRILA